MPTRGALTLYVTFAHPYLLSVLTSGRRRGLWHIPVVLSLKRQLSRSLVSRLRIRRRSVHCSRAPDIPNPDIHYPAIRDTDDPSDRCLLRDFVIDRSIICLRKMAPLLEPGRVLWHRHGVSVRWNCRDHPPMVHYAEEPGKWHWHCRQRDRGNGVQSRVPGHDSINRPTMGLQDPWNHGIRRQFCMCDPDQG